MRSRDAALLALGFLAGAVTVAAGAYALLQSGAPAPATPAAGPADDAARTAELEQRIEELQERLAERGARVHRDRGEDAAPPAAPDEGPPRPRGPVESEPIPYVHRELMRYGEVLGPEAVRELVLRCLDTTAEDAARFEAAARLLPGSPHELAALADRLLVGGAAPETMRPLVLSAVASSASPERPVPTSVRSLAYDPSAPTAEWQLAAQALLRAAPPEGRAVIESRLASTDAAQRASAVGALAAARDKDTLPLLVETVMREDLREHVAPLVDAIALTKDRKWSAAQLVGPPDTPYTGDLGTAWASKQQQMGEVWIRLDYDTAVEAVEVRVRETLASGAIVRVELSTDGRTWETAWEGAATPGAPVPRWFAPPLRDVSAAVRHVRLVLDTDAVPGWSEIDAVELVGAGGLRQWASRATASTSYAD